MALQSPGRPVATVVAVACGAQPPTLSPRSTSHEASYDVSSRPAAAFVGSPRQHSAAGYATPVMARVAERSDVAGGVAAVGSPDSHVRSTLHGSASCSAVPLLGGRTSHGVRPPAAPSSPPCGTQGVSQRAVLRPADPAASSWVAGVSSARAPGAPPRSAAALSPRSPRNNAAGAAAAAAAVALVALPQATAGGITLLSPRAASRANDEQMPPSASLVALRIHAPKPVQLASPGRGRPAAESENGQPAAHHVTKPVVLSSPPRSPGYHRSTPSLHQGCGSTSSNSLAARARVCTQICFADGPRRDQAMTPMSAAAASKSTSELLPGCSPRGHAGLQQQHGPLVAAAAAASRAAVVAKALPTAPPVGSHPSADVRGSLLRREACTIRVRSVSSQRSRPASLERVVDEPNCTPAVLADSWNSMTADAATRQAPIRQASARSQLSTASSSTTLPEQLPPAEGGSILVCTSSWVGLRNNTSPASPSQTCRLGTSTATLPPSSVYGNGPEKADSDSDSSEQDDDQENQDPVQRKKRLSLRVGAAIAKSACQTLQRRGLADAPRVLREAMKNIPADTKAMHPERAEAGRDLLVGTSEIHAKHERGESPPPLLRDPTGASLLVPEYSNQDLLMVERQFFDSMPLEHVQIERVASVINSRLVERFLERVAAQKACVEATFHGLLTDDCGTACYGHGVYVGTHAGVAHQYAAPDAEGQRFMCVVLVVVGNEVVKGEQGKYSSVTAVDRLVNPTQYCFVDEDRLLVSHLITYRVTGGELQRTGGGWRDPFQEKLSLAMRRAAGGRRRKGYR
eukprot:TRINITY_DN13748_c0_g1_i1.p1 TRINITY_DN13748_c0_g1~~TRINITY_DN13748_c0_g1_i1.p1  ORF type:complete len:865 (-),score=149.71 TRINITY_DN13748_c0_g1_i1:45-2447(-)